MFASGCASLGDQGKVCHHRDYRDTGEELDMKLPVLGILMRALQGYWQPERVGLRAGC